MAEQEDISSALDALVEAGLLTSKQAKRVKVALHDAPRLLETNRSRRMAALMCLLSFPFWIALAHSPLPNFVQAAGVASAVVSVVLALVLSLSTTKM